MNVVAFNGSPHKDGNTSILGQALSELKMGGGGGHKYGAGPPQRPPHGVYRLLPVPREEKWKMRL